MLSRKLCLYVCLYVCLFDWVFVFSMFLAQIIEWVKFYLVFKQSLVIKGTVNNKWVQAETRESQELIETYNIGFGKILTQFYVNFSRQEPQIDVLQVS